MTDKPKPPVILDKVVDTVLAYHPKPKTRPAKKRKSRAAKMRKASERNG
jgi:hypothetical protein